MDELCLATEAGIRTVALPAIITGVCGYPLDQAARPSAGVAVPAI